MDWDNNKCIDWSLVNGCLYEDIIPDPNFCSRSKIDIIMEEAEKKKIFEITDILVGEAFGFAWGFDEMEADGRYKGNNLFYVSMYDHMYQVRRCFDSSYFF